MWPRRLLASASEDGGSPFRAHRAFGVRGHVTAFLPRRSNRTHRGNWETCLPVSGTPTPIVRRSHGSLLKVRVSPTKLPFIFKGCSRQPKRHVMPSRANFNESPPIQPNRAKSSSESSRVGDLPSLGSFGKTSRRSLPAPDAPAGGARLSERAAPVNPPAQVLPNKRRRHPFAGRTLRIQIAVRQSPPSVPSRYCATRAAYTLPRQQETGGPWSVVLLLRVVTPLLRQM
jgi:hypothetical protein